ncbi:zymogen granule membrane protein 16-like [Pimephales promelas]|uniref:zymogen granule membrane protein 16-like n=1 Tax=Pimephales promelas TaxID=90988 RepID=UPI0019557D2F|nr:zymogen granule membrane protein 16-like [Pimephales promelas]KAG1940104.1 prostatic spermine-binding protein [Pimephales promelas]KAG1940105.1 prostatic spermine-binding protein [Pimephales promelas]KAG1940106.1 prostatic spermine-binding protein [Pimephales promelas]KAG1940107.1 prostatic spermine-binding protein [Pimephales promelas]
MLPYFVVLSCLYAMSMTMPIPDNYSYSPAVGDGTGTEFTTSQEGRITGIRLYEYPYYGYYYYNYINGLQLQYDGNWTELVGTNGYGNERTMTLFDHEYIVQVSGKYYGGYITELMFVTNEGRSFKVGQSAGLSFNLYPTHDGSALRFLSGRQDGFALTSIGAHWAVLNTS